MRKVWVITANRAEMRLFIAENVHTLVEKEALIHAESHMHTQDLISDKQGSYRGRFGVDTLQEKTDTKKKEAQHFATQIAQLLEKGTLCKEVDRIYLFASPEFMGHLRTAIKPHVAKLIAQEIHKDVTHLSAAEIREYLPPVL